MSGKKRAGKLRGGKTETSAGAHFYVVSMQREPLGRGGVGKVVLGLLDAFATLVARVTI